MGGLIFLWIVFNLLPGSLQTDRGTQLVKMLMQNYDKDVLPKINPSKPVQVKFGVMLNAILALDPVKEVFRSSLWLDYEWTDARLTWTPSDYDEIKMIYISVDRMWTPDVTLFNSISDAEQTAPRDIKIQVRHDGFCHWFPEGVFQSTCEIDPTWYPYDTQTCRLIFGSYSHLARDVTITNHHDVVMRQAGGWHDTKEWAFTESSVIRSVHDDGFSNDTYISLLYNVQLRRQSYHTRLQIFLPPALLSLLSILVFLLPVACKERITLGILQLAMLGGLWRETSSSFHHAFVVTFSDTFYCTIFFGSFLSFILNVLVVKLHYGERKMPAWVRRAMILVGNLKMCCTAPCNKYKGDLTDNNQDDDAPRIEDSVQINKGKMGTDQSGEWIMLSQLLDRIFIICYLVFFFFSCICIFGTIP